MRFSQIYVASQIQTNICKHVNIDSTLGSTDFFWQRESNSIWQAVQYQVNLVKHASEFIAVALGTSSTRD